MLFGEFLLICYYNIIPGGNADAPILKKDTEDMKIKDT